MKYRSIRVKIFTAIIIFTVLIITAVCFSVSGFYKDSLMRRLKNVCLDYAKTASNYIDGDKIEGYLKTGVADEYWLKIEKYITKIEEVSHMKYYYVFVPTETDIIYIWDSEYSGTESLLRHENYMNNGKQSVEESFRREPVSNLYIFENDATYGNIASLFYPIFNSYGDPVALVGVDLSLPDIKTIIRHFNLRIIFSVMGLLILLMINFYIFISREILIPIKKLNSVTTNFVHNIDNHEKLKIDVKNKDEIGELAKSFEKMDCELKNYIGELSHVTAEKERIATELNVATQIQKSMLPSIFPAFPDRPEVDIYASMNPAKEVGGDFYDFFFVDKTHLAVVVADVSGKGVPAALFMVIGKTLIKDHTKPGVEPGKIFEEVNNILCQSNSEELFITAFEGILDLTTGQFDFVNAGHEMPFICRKDGQFETLNFRSGFVLAGMENMKYKTGSTKLEPGDRLFQYTDGVTEAMNSKNEEFGMDRLTTALNKNSGKNPQALIESVQEEITLFQGDRQQFDDITLLCLDFKELLK